MQCNGLLLAYANAVSDHVFDQIIAVNGDDVLCGLLQSFLCIFCVCRGGYKNTLLRVFDVQATDEIAYRGTANVMAFLITFGLQIDNTQPNTCLLYTSDAADE